VASLPLFQITRLARATSIRDASTPSGSKPILHGAATRTAERFYRPLPRPRNWPSRVNRSETEAELKALRTAVPRSSPLGNPAWQERIARRMGIEHALRPRGRPAWRICEMAEEPLLPGFFVLGLVLLVARSLKRERDAYAV
jgi:hypothetical protein